MIGRDQLRKDPLIERAIVNCLPRGTLSFEAFINLLGVWVGPVGSAAIMVFPSEPPRLVIDREFVKKHCRRDEHLFLLVMHEISHVLLAHTRLFPRPTAQHNIAFDALINAWLSRRYPEPEYRGFFEDVNPADVFPHCLLRPPDGWPEKPVYPEGIGPAGTTTLLMRLYPPQNTVSLDHLPLYAEVMDLLKTADSPDDSQGEDQSPKEGGGHTEAADMSEPCLLGCHDEANSKQIEIDRVLRELLKPASSLDKQTLSRSNSLLETLDFAVGQQAGSNNFFEIQTPEAEARQRFKKILRWSLRGDSRSDLRERRPVERLSGKGVMLNPRDRSNSVYAALNIPKLFYVQNESVEIRRRRHGHALVYLDVSGSMEQVLGLLTGMILPYLRRRELTLYAFAMQVSGPHTVEDICRHNLNAGGGTSMRAVLNHLIDCRPVPPRVIIVTDGQIDRQPPYLIQKILSPGIEVCTVLIGQEISDAHVHDFSKHVVHLPALG